mmetsp:Transcript_27149/g.91256  ORF Transcript_27149/g.91256 Transcript_27149/m.91256 type:complete len:204 (+) Transcript_27149:192-803(+)
MPRNMHPFSTLRRKHGAGSAPRTDAPLLSVSYAMLLPSRRKSALCTRLAEIVEKTLSRFKVGLGGKSRAQWGGAAFDLRDSLIFGAAFDRRGAESRPSKAAVEKAPFSEKRVGNSGSRDGAEDGAAPAMSPVEARRRCCSESSKRRRGTRRPRKRSAGTKGAFLGEFQKGAFSRCVFSNCVIARGARSAQITKNHPTQPRLPC